jgi:hypothetical protein
LKNSYTESQAEYSLILRCNMCSMDIDEKEVEFHITSQHHLENKSKTSTNDKGLDKSVANMWYNSLR